MISQIELFAGITTVLQEHGIVTMNERQMNAVIKAATDISDALAKEHQPAIPESGIDKWLASDDTGLSSRYMARALCLAARRFMDAAMISSPRARPEYPRDPADFRRCVRLLDACPELVPHIPALAENSGPVWKLLAENWGRLETLYRTESPSGECPRLYEELQKIREIAEGAAP